MILLSPWTRPLRNGKPHPKNYPWWPELVALLPEPLIQIGVKGETALVADVRFGAPFDVVRALVRQADLWIGVDNFLQHLAHQEAKPGVVLWGQGDPNIFGYPENLNLLKARNYLRERPFDIWEAVPCRDDAFLRPEVVVERLRGRWLQVWLSAAVAAAR